MADVDTLGVCLPQNWGRNGGWVQVSSWDLTLTYQGGEKGLLKLCLNYTSWWEWLGSSGERCISKCYLAECGYMMIGEAAQLYDPWWIAHYIHGWWTSGLLYFTVYLPWKICFIFDMSLIKCRNAKNAQLGLQLKGSGEHIVTLLWKNL